MRKVQLYVFAAFKPVILLITTDVPLYDQSIDTGDVTGTGAVVVSTRLTTVQPTGRDLNFQGIVRAWVVVAIAYDVGGPV